MRQSTSTSHRIIWRVLPCKLHNWVSGNVDCQKSKNKSRQSSRNTNKQLLKKATRFETVAGEQQSCLVLLIVVAATVRQDNMLKYNSSNREYTCDVGTQLGLADKFRTLSSLVGRRDQSAGFLERIGCSSRRCTCRECGLVTKRPSRGSQPAWVGSRRSLREVASNEVQRLRYCTQADLFCFFYFFSHKYDINRLKMRCQFGIQLYSNIDNIIGNRLKKTQNKT